MSVWQRIKSLLHKPAAIPAATRNVWPLWRQFRIDATYARNYPIAYSLYLPGQTHRDIVLDMLLPELLLIKATAILDTSLVSVVAGMPPMPKKYRPTLGGRVRYLIAAGTLKNGRKLLEVVNRRNDFAHVLRERTSASTQIDTKKGWERFDADVLVVEQALQNLGALPTAIPKFEYRCERSALTDAPNGWQRTFTLQVTQNGKPASEVSWTQTIHHAE